MIKTLTKEFNLEGANNMHHVALLFHEFFVRKDYDWFYAVHPGDVVMDIGANIGMFTCHALDLGAAKVYAIEPNIKLIETTMRNALPHIVNKVECPVIPIQCLIGDPNDGEKMKAHIHTDGDADFDKTSIPVRTFKDIITTYGIEKIDFLKMDCEGGEYDVLTEENYEYIANNVKHIALEIHVDAFEGATELFKKFRDDFLSKFPKEKIKFMFPQDAEKMKDSYVDSRQSRGGGSYWMIYICNQSI